MTNQNLKDVLVGLYSRKSIGLKPYIQFQRILEKLETRKLKMEQKNV